MRLKEESGEWEVLSWKGPGACSYRQAQHWGWGLEPRARSWWIAKQLCDLGQVTLTFRSVSSPVSQVLDSVILKLLWVPSFPLARIALV